MTSKDLEQELARGEALSVARLLGRDAPTAGDPVGFTSTQVRIAAVLLAGWSTDADIRDALRPVFEAAVPDQRALIALGDIDTWLRNGRTARGWWVQAAAGPDPDLAALAAWRAGRADLRGGRPDDALPLLRQADLAGIREASLAVGRLLEKHGERTDADAAFRRARSGEGVLVLAEERLRADDLDGAERELTGFTAGSEFQRSWEYAIRGEIAFWRGDLAAAETNLGGAMKAPGSWPRRAQLRLAQIAIAELDPVMAHHWIRHVVDGDDSEAEQARLLLELHRDLIEQGERIAKDEEEEPPWE
ncbi:hypothetical protein EV188_10335 [Actinomycetospora succinea]|uniref:Tetratricopeptide repeat protein n=1 Tax=Actinomycetospora succinea TaxID=663603 RepID=A0A4R6VCT1_9PSEU|nr:hypothetical protein [Actinomycetospora succinea]TDQ60542.1 hypothetical protein EV188_10335 [Actinomycetospora succinea]